MQFMLLNKFKEQQKTQSVDAVSKFQATIWAIHPGECLGSNSCEHLSSALRPVLGNSIQLSVDFLGDMSSFK